MPPTPDAPPFFGVFMAVFVVIVALGVGLAIYRSARVARQGHNPFTLENDLATRALDSAALARPRCKSERLAELDVLRASGTISETEHAEARRRIIAE